MITTQDHRDMQLWLALAWAIMIPIVAVNAVVAIGLFTWMQLV